MSAQDKLSDCHRLILNERIALCFFGNSFPFYFTPRPIFQPSNNPINFCLLQWLNIYKGFISFHHNVFCVKKMAQPPCFYISDVFKEVFWTQSDQTFVVKTFPPQPSQPQTPQTQTLSLYWALITVIRDSVLKGQVGHETPTPNSILPSTKPNSGWFQLTEGVTLI